MNVLPQQTDKLNIRNNILNNLFYFPLNRTYPQPVYKIYKCKYTLIVIFISAFLGKLHKWTVPTTTRKIANVFVH